MLCGDLGDHLRLAHAGRSPQHHRGVVALFGAGEFTVENGEKLSWTHGGFRKKWMCCRFRRKRGSGAVTLACSMAEGCAVMAERSTLGRPVGMGRLSNLRQASVFSGSFCPAETHCWKKKRPFKLARNKLGFNS